MDFLSKITAAAARVDVVAIRSRLRVIAARIPGKLPRDPYLSQKKDDAEVTLIMERNVVTAVCPAIRFCLE
jgi:hypothetical protein